MLTAAQMRAARALVGMEQKMLAELSGVSLPTIQRMEASNGVVRGVIETLMKVMGALEAAGVEFINEGAVSSGGGRGVRLRRAGLSAVIALTEKMAVYRVHFLDQVEHDDDGSAIAAGHRLNVMPHLGIGFQV
jgi:transcriptional regulator with XRE-family HTH domain